MIIHDIANKKILPYLRGLLIHELHRRNISQHRISRLLGVSQPLVNKYLSKTYTSYKEKLVKMGFPEDEILYVVNNLASYLERGDMLRFLIVSNYYIEEFATRYACRSLNWLRDYCSRGSITDPFIEEYREFVNKFISKPLVYKLVPEVGVNIAYAPRGASTPGDIIALTGRIVRVDSRAGYAGEPMYGASRHLSRILITAIKYNKSKRLAVNLSNQPWIRDSITRMGLKVIETGPHDSADSFWTSLEEALSKKPDAVVDEGGRGLEPNIYILSRDFVELEGIIDFILQHSVV